MGRAGIDRFRILAVIDDFNSECLAAVSEVSLSGLRDECLNEDVFTTLAEARRIIDAWRIDYNTVRPHGRLPPAVFGATRKRPEEQRGGTLRRSGLRAPPR